MAFEQQEVHLVSRPTGIPTADNFKLTNGTISEIKEGQFLARTLWLSVDPYMRGRMKAGKSYVEPFTIGKPLQGGCIGQVIKSKNNNFEEGQYISTMGPWAEFFVSNGEDAQIVDASVPLQHYLGALGMPGLTAYAGIRRIAKPEQGQTIFVSSASGAVGSMVCQLCKARGCSVIGSSGSSDKIRWLKETLRLDAVINYKEQDSLSQALADAAPDGIHVYWDNVGAEHLEAAIDNLKTHGLIVGCGMIASYNSEEPPKAPRNLMQIIAKRLTFQGMLVFDHSDLRSEFIKEAETLLNAGTLVIEETIVEGLENAPQAFLGLFEGKNLGKMLVRVAMD